MIEYLAESILSALLSAMKATVMLILQAAYWSLWLILHFTLGILSLEEKATSAFTWLVLLVTLFVYYDGHNYDWLSLLARPMALCKYFQQRLGILDDLDVPHDNDLANYNDVLLENQINNYRETEPLTMQLEAENRVNENEENSLVEADRYRIDNENRTNVELENGHNEYRVDLENRQNVEREQIDVEMNRENERNQTRYFLRQRARLRVNDDT